MAEFQRARTDQQPGRWRNPLPPNTDETEPKVKAARTAAGGTAAVSACVVWVLATYVFKGEVPGPVVGVVEALVPGLLAGIAAHVAGRYAHHQYRLRPDERPPTDAY